MTACTPSSHVFLGRPLFLLSRGIQSIINFGIVVYEIMWKNMVEPDEPQTTVRRMRFCALPAGWLRLHTHARARARTHTILYVILLFHGNNGYANTLQCYAVRILFVILLLRSALNYCASLAAIVIHTVPQHSLSQFDTAIQDHPQTGVCCQTRYQRSFHTRN